MSDSNNTSGSNTLQHPSSVDAYIRHNWKLIPIPPDTKGPTHTGWNLEENCLKDHNDLLPNYGIGLAHAYTGTMALDIDHWERAVKEFSNYGINLQKLYEAPDAVVIDSGNPGHGKLLYKMPDGVILRSKKLIDTDDTGKRYNYIDFRCSNRNGTTVQDVLPPSIHPTTRKAYRWSGNGNWQRLPQIPQQLLLFWQYLLDKEDKLSQEQRLIIDHHLDYNEIKDALYKISPDIEYDEWYRTGMALHWAACHAGNHELYFKLWDDWSKQSNEKYPGASKLLSHWKSFKSNGDVTLGTLFEYARQFGWKKPLPDVSELFQNIDKPVIDPLNVGNKPAPDINVSLFPKVLADRAMEISEHIGCDPLVPLWAGLGAVCGAVDARIKLEVLPGFKVPPVLWLMTIGDPADKKSPGSKPMFTVLKDLEKADLPRYKQALLDWEGKEAAHVAAKKNFLNYASDPSNHMENDVIPSVPDLPNPPVPLKITVSDITSQKLVRSAADRPRGLLCYLDEMNAWVQKINDIRSGDDRSSWVMSYESDSYEMDRVGAGNIWCDNFAVSIYGNIQPQVFQRNLNALSSDGLLQRFLPAILRPNQTRLGNPVPDELTTMETWNNTIRNIYTIPPITYKLSSKAYGCFRTFQQWYEKLKHNERVLRADPIYMTALGKLEGLVARITLIFHILISPYELEVPVETLEKVLEIVKGYYIPAIKYVYGELGGLNSESIEYWLTKHIIHISDHEKITLSELKRSAKVQLENIPLHQRDQIIRDGMVHLENCKWVMIAENNPRTCIWLINPVLKEQFKEQRKAIIKAKQEVQDAIHSNVILKHPNSERRIVHGYREFFDD